jgi:hypothetical protein
MKRSADCQYYRLILRIANNARETLIHVILIMTVKEGLATVVGNEIGLSP